jgi:hypothetical protein
MTPHPAQAIILKPGRFFDNIVFMAMENENYGSIVGSSSAPFINTMVSASATLGSQFDAYGSSTGRCIDSRGNCGISSQNCSAECYVNLISAYCCVSDGYSTASLGSSITTVMDEMTLAGLSWSAYCEKSSGGSQCPRGADHFPFWGFSSLYSSGNWHDSTYGTDTEFISAAGTNAPNLLWLTPTDDHNMHNDCGSGNVKCGDNFAKSILVGSGGTLSNPSTGSLFASSLFTGSRRVLFVLWWDENSHPLELFYGSKVVKAGFVASGTYDHVSILKLMEDNWGLNYISNTFNSASATGVESEIFTPSGNFGPCASLPTGWYCNVYGGTSGTAATIDSNGAFHSTLAANGLGSSNNFQAVTAQKGTFPWSGSGGCSSASAPASGDGISFDTNVLGRVGSGFIPNVLPTSGTSSQWQYNIYIGLYYWLPNGAATGSSSETGSITSQCFDTQVRVEVINGAFTAVGHTDTYAPCSGAGTDSRCGGTQKVDSFGWDTVTLSSSDIAINKISELVADVDKQAQGVIAAYGITGNPIHQLAGIEIGVEGFQFDKLDVTFASQALFSSCNIKGDTDSSGAINIQDLATIARDFDYNLGEGNVASGGYFAGGSTKAGADVNQDGKIDILDLAIPAVYWMVVCQ